MTSLGDIPLRRDWDVSVHPAPRRHHPRGGLALALVTGRVVDQAGGDLIDVPLEQGERRHRRRDVLDLGARVVDGDCEGDELEDDLIGDVVGLDRNLVHHHLVHLVDEEPPADAVVHRGPLVEWHVVDRDEARAVLGAPDVILLML